MAKKKKTKTSDGVIICLVILFLIATGLFINSVIDSNRIGNLEEEVSGLKETIAELQNPIEPEPEGSFTICMNDSAENLHTFEVAEQFENIKLLPRDEEYRTQEQAIAYHNERNERMLSLPDIFQLVKENNIESIESLRKDFKDYWLVTSTRIIYNKDKLSAKIIHNAGSTVVKPTEIDLKEVPVCSPTYLNELIETEAGLNYLRALINDKKATKEEIINFFVNLSGKKESKIRFWTPSQSSRKDKQVRSVELCFYGFDRFVVYGNFWFDGDDGFSRGVIINSAKQTKILGGD